MVCVPCIFLPILLAIYLKFIQPFILRLMPERWSAYLEPILYPTCPIKRPPAKANEADEADDQHKEANETETTVENKKDL